MMQTITAEKRRVDAGVRCELRVHVYELSDPQHSADSWAYSVSTDRGRAPLVRSTLRVRTLDDVLHEITQLLRVEVVREGRHMARVDDQLHIALIVRPETRGELPWRA